eukprot:14210904-Alexandrium_andersonii.AAC.1
MGVCGLPVERTPSADAGRKSGKAGGRNGKRADAVSGKGAERPERSEGSEHPGSGTPSQREQPLERSGMLQNAERTRP